MTNKTNFVHTEKSINSKTYLITVKEHVLFSCRKKENKEKNVLIVNLGVSFFLNKKIFYTFIIIRYFLYGRNSSKNHHKDVNSQLRENILNII